MSKLILGLVGGIGSGKSTVAKMLGDAGVAVIESDVLNREELARPDVIERLVSWFGESVRDQKGAICRSSLADIIFEDANARAKLEGFIHPRIATRRESLIESFQSDTSVLAIALDSPLLIEAGLDSRCDAVIFVESAPKGRSDRVARTRGWSQEEWQRRENLQEALDNKRTRADHIVINNSGLDELRKQVNSLLSTLLSRAPDS